MIIGNLERHHLTDQTRVPIAIPQSMVLSRIVSDTKSQIMTGHRNLSQRSFKVIENVMI